MEEWNRGMVGLKKRAFHQSFVILIHDYISLIRFVIPGSTEPAPYLIRGNQVFFWIPAFAGMTDFDMINVAVYRCQCSKIPSFQLNDFALDERLTFQTQYGSDDL
jgi:hypothetical protein